MILTLRPIPTARRVRNLHKVITIITRFRGGETVEAAHRTHWITAALRLWVRGSTLALMWLRTRSARVLIVAGWGSCRDSQQRWCIVQRQGRTVVTTSQPSSCPAASAQPLSTCRTSRCCRRRGSPQLLIRISIGYFDVQIFISRILWIILLEIYSIYQLRKSLYFQINIFSDSISQI